MLNMFNMFACAVCVRNGVTRVYGCNTCVYLLCDCVTLGSWGSCGWAEAARQQESSCNLGQEVQDQDQGQGRDQGQGALPPQAWGSNAAGGTWACLGTSSWVQQPSSGRRHWNTNPQPSQTHFQRVVCASPVQQAPNMNHIRA